VHHIRSAIFGLEAGRDAPSGVRAQVLDVVREAAGPLGFEASVRFQGAVDAHVTGTLGADVLAVVREGLANVARHAQATRAEVAVVVGDDLLVEVVDDGVGPTGDGPTTGHGSTNLAERARGHGGTCRLEGLPAGGAALSWRVPLR
jgi:signal transduction histidine kinase